MSDTPLCTSLLSPALSDFEMGFWLGIKAYDGYLYDGYLETKEWLEKDGELGLCDPRHQFIAYLQQWTQKRAELELAVIQERDVWAKPENPAPKNPAPENPAPENPAPENPAPEPEDLKAAKETKRRRVEADTQLPIDGAFDAEEEQQ
jgi:hypothetical protein